MRRLCEDTIVRWMYQPYSVIECRDYVFTENTKRWRFVVALPDASEVIMRSTGKIMMLSGILNWVCSKDEPMRKLLLVFVLGLFGQCAFSRPDDIR